jgi:hypothetical protein
MNDESSIVSRLARQLVIEYGESAPSMADSFIERCRGAGDIEGTRNWETVRHVLLRLQPGGASNFKS